MNVTSPFLPPTDELASGPRYWHEISLPIDNRSVDVLLVSDGDALVATWFGPILSAKGGGRSTWVRDPKPLKDPADQLAAYAAGELKDFDLRLRPSGTAFQMEVWSELAQIPYGVTTTYGHIASSIGRPTGSRAVGAAVGSNPIGIIVPCHRVIGANGSLTGYAGGLDNKMALLHLEGVTAFCGARRAG